MKLHSDNKGKDAAEHAAGDVGGDIAGDAGASKDNRRLFLRHVAQTSSSPLGLEIVRAEGMYLYDVSGRRYLDAIGGISVCNTGHRHPRVVQAIRDQADQYLHLLVYGELIQSPQVQYATLLAAHLPASLNAVYFTNSGAEATEGAMKLAKRVTGRTGIVAFNQSYHGSTQGALSVMGDEYWRNAYRPLLPDIRHVDYNSAEALDAITDRTACVIAETVQAERGVFVPEAGWLRQLRERCNAMGVLLVLDEIQAGFGRTGTLWGFERYGVVPDILLLGKALGGGMPMGAFIADRQLMWTLTGDPVLGHITTFGGHPVCCAAGMAAMKVLLEEEWIGQVARKEASFRRLLKHPSIRAVRSSGLLIAVEFGNFEINKRVIDACIEKGLLTDWFLFAPQCMRIAPPLIITDHQIEEICSIIIASIPSS
jgi:acetylornithine/N-succinyldiaminopimelate aminotransferase